MKKAIMTSAAMMSVAALVLTGCGKAPEDTQKTAAGDGKDFKACLVSDAGGWDDESFNESAYKGLQAAKEDLEIQTATAESQAASDFGPNVDNMVQQNCNLTMGVGFLLEDAIEKAAQNNPDMHFGLIDSTFADSEGKAVELDNAKPILFNTAEAAYLAGYLAADASKTKTVATFGGIKIPSVTVFMDGFADGVQKYNEEHQEDVKLLGWNKETQEGAFSGDFENQAQGQKLTEQLISQKADIIMPVAGPVGLGAAAAAKEAGDTKIIWVDTDGYESTDYGDIILTSVTKEIAKAVEDTIGQAVNDSFTADPYVGTLKNGGVGLAPFHDFDDEIPEETKEELEQLKDQIIEGDITVESPNSPKV